ncbi:MAG: hypothetical protein Q8J67_01640, partial [Rhodocyclaceae bacterium]|nr:hypothetical protein [Rhodocyclaceae bacterium]
MFGNHLQLRAAGDRHTPATSQQQCENPCQKLFHHLSPNALQVNDNNQRHTRSQAQAANKAARVSVMPAPTFAAAMLSDT